MLGESTWDKYQRKSPHVNGWTTWLLFIKGLVINADCNRGLACTICINRSRPTSFGVSAAPCRNMSNKRYSKSPLKPRCFAIHLTSGKLQIATNCLQAELEKPIASWKSENSEDGTRWHLQVLHLDSDRKTWKIPRQIRFETIHSLLEKEGWDVLPGLRDATALFVLDSPLPFDRSVVPQEVASWIAPKWWTLRGCAPPRLAARHAEVQHPMKCLDLVQNRCQQQVVQEVLHFGHAHPDESPELRQWLRLWHLDLLSVHRFDAVTPKLVNLMGVLKPILDFDSEALAMLQDLVSSAVLVSLIVA